jgi:hypothetical protein
MRPARKVCASQGDVIVEYGILLLGPSDFELIHETARTVGTTGTEVEKSDG